MNTMITKADIERLKRDKEDAEAKRVALNALKGLGGREIRHSDLMNVRDTNL